MEAAGAFAWLGLWQYRRDGEVFLPRTLLAVGLFALHRSASWRRPPISEAEIRHPEIMSAEEAGAGSRSGALGTRGGLVCGEQDVDMGRSGDAGTRSGCACCSASRHWWICVCWAWMKSVPFCTLCRLLPWAVLGFGINLITGMLFFVAAYEQYTTNAGFYHWKLGLIMLAGLNVLVLHDFRRALGFRPRESVRPPQRSSLRGIGAGAGDWSDLRGPINRSSGRASNDHRFDGSGERRGSGGRRCGGLPDR